MLWQTHRHVSFTRLGISSSNNKLYRLLYIRELKSHVNDCPVGNLIWARMSGVIIWCKHKCPGWSFDVSTNVRPCQKSRGNECLWEDVRTPGNTVRRVDLVIFSRFSFNIFFIIRPIQKLLTFICNPGLKLRLCTFSENPWHHAIILKRPHTGDVSE